MVKRLTMNGQDVTCIELYAWHKDMKVMDYIMFFFYMDKGHLIAFCIITTYQIYSIALKCKGIDIVQFKDSCIIFHNESIAKEKTCYKNC